ncbi:MAG: NAD(P)H-dependent oxidoreductase subunit E [Bacteroidales bacterium]|nr:NAD(P)H-dependent oxidoreductase subunit E [Bacteroidales bacterium]
MENDTVYSAISKYNQDKTRLMDILIEIQDNENYISDDAVRIISEKLELSIVDVEQTISFYHFLSKKSLGKYTIYLNNSVISNMNGRQIVAETFENEVGCKFGKVTEDGTIGLFDTACIGMSDQEPAALINGNVFIHLTPFRVKEIVRDIRAGKDVKNMHTSYLGGGQNKSEYLKSVVRNNIMRMGPVLSDDYNPGTIIKKKLVQLAPEQVIEEIKTSNIRGRGGAGFPTGFKWEFCRKAKGDKKYILCNADEGEPGTFKDRVILTERPKLLFEGMVIAGYSIGATEGILYLRYEYKYLKNYLENILEETRGKNLLGKDIGGIKGFNFDIRIQLGAGAYVCGEESALIESVEGKRGEPRDRPPFPVEKGYNDCPTVVNNVETLCSVVKIMLNGGEWYSSLGTHESTGTKVLSISGDCRYPGIYEVEWGLTISDILDMVGATGVQAIQVGGPSGSLIGPEEFERKLCYSDLVTGGSFIIFNYNRDLLKNVVLNFTDFFIEESCGSCVPCRAMTPLLKQKLEKILSGNGVANDLEDILKWGKLMKTNRCGLGHTAANPILTSLKNFRYLYEEKLERGKEYETGFNLEQAVSESCEATTRVPNF